MKNIKYHKHPEGPSNIPIIRKTSLPEGHEVEISIKSGVVHKFTLTSRTGNFSVLDLIALICQNSDLKILNKKEKR
jgi:hypothetical protein